MLDISHWLLALSLLALCFQGVQLSNLRSGFHLFIIGVVILMLTMFLSELIAQKSILKLHRLLEKQCEFIFIIAVTETGLLCFSKSPYKVPIISAFGALLYGQLLFFQSGLFDLSFSIQGLLYGLCIVCFLLLNRYLAIIETLWRFILFILLVGLAVMTTSSTSKNNESLSSVDFNALLISALSFTIFLLAGYIIGIIQKPKERNKR